MPKGTAKLQPWERQEGESAKAFEAFVTYRDMGAGRTLSAVSEKLSKSRQLLTRWKSAWKWEERAREYDNDLEKQAHEQAKKAVKSMVGRHISIATQLQTKAMLALQQLPVDQMSAKEILSFFIEGTKMERANRVEAAGGETGSSAAGTQQPGGGSLASSVMEAYKKRKDGGKDDD